jgi:hypothetical protein
MICLEKDWSAILGFILGSFCMRISLISGLLVLWLSGVAACAQDKVAEAEYEAHGASNTGASITKTATRWLLTTTSSGGYHLESEIQNQPAGMRVVQTEELNEQFVPLAIGYRLYRKDQQSPGITANCELSSAVICSGESGADRAAASKPYKPTGPFWLWMEGVFSLDLPWLLDGAVNMAHLESGKTQVATLSVFGGTAVMLGDAVNIAKLEAIQRPGQTLNVIAPNKPIAWKLSTKEESPLELVGTETLEINGTKVAVKHYTFGKGDKPMNLWTAGSGLVVKFNNMVLANYKQYRKLIPELPTQGQPASPVLSH